MTTRQDELLIVSFMQEQDRFRHLHSWSYLSNRNHLCACIESFQTLANTWIGEVVLGVLPHLAGILAAVLITRMHLDSRCSLSADSVEVSQDARN